jgi:hypothetical protein
MFLLPLKSIEFYTFNHSFQHTFAVVFIVRAFDNLGLAFVLVEVLDEAVVVVVVPATDGASSSVPESNFSGGENIALILFNLSAPQLFFKNS